MGKLSANRETVELPAVPAFTAAQIQRGLDDWTACLLKAKAEGNRFEQDAAMLWLNCWLDRKNAV